VDRNKYQDSRIKWLIAQKIQGREWEIKRLGTQPTPPTLTDLLDNTPVGEMKVSEFGVFRNRADWWKCRPRRYYRGYEVPMLFGTAMGGLINALESDWF